MKLMAHIVGKDLFRLRWILLLWVVLVTAQMTLAGIEGALDQAQGYAFYLVAWVFGGLFLPLLNFGLVLGVQNDDPVSDSDAFWITRPISAGQLLRAKLTALAVLWLVPCLALLPWWLGQGFDRAQLEAALLQTIGWQALLTLAALPFALISSNASRFIMNVILAAGGAFALFELLQLFGVGSDLSFSPGAPGRWTWAVAGLWLAATVAISLVQFLTRRTRQSIALLVAAVVACATITGWWPRSSATAATTGPRPEAAASALRFASALPKEARSPRLLGDPPRATATINGSVMELVLTATAGAKTGETFSEEGRKLRIIEVVPNDPARGVVITVGESMPDSNAGGWHNLGGPLAPLPAEEFYFLVQREQGRAVAGTIRPAGPELTASGIHHRRRELLFPLKEEQFKQWGEGAMLIKVTARDAGALATVVETPRFESKADGHSAAAPSSL